MNPHPRMLLFLPSQPKVAKRTLGVSLLVQLPECNICGLWASAGQMSQTKLHFPVSHLGAGV